MPGGRRRFCPRGWIRGGSGGRGQGGKELSSDTVTPWKRKSLGGGRNLSLQTLHTQEDKLHDIVLVGC